MVVHTCNTSTQEAEAGELRAGDKPRLHIKTLLTKPKTNQINKIILANHFHYHPQSEVLKLLKY
jgi:hypothetical protein